MQRAELELPMIWCHCALCWTHWEAEVLDDCPLCGGTTSVLEQEDDDTEETRLGGDSSE